MELTINSKLKTFEQFVNKNAIEIGFKFKQLDTPDAYFNQAPLCGIFYLTSEDKWLFVHQEFPEPGDNPSLWLQKRTYNSLDELIQSETDEIYRRQRIQEKR